MGRSQKPDGKIDPCHFLINAGHMEEMGMGELGRCNEGYSSVGGWRGKIHQGKVFIREESNLKSSVSDRYGDKMKLPGKTIKGYLSQPPYP